MRITLKLFLSPRLCASARVLFLSCLVGSQTPYAHGEILPRDLQQYCFRCHGEEKVKGKVNLVKAFAAKPHGLAGDLDLIEKMIEALANDEMPPEKETQPTANQRQRWVAELKQILNEQLAKQSVSTRVPIRRMNRFEYNNAVKELFHPKTDRGQVPPPMVAKEFHS